MIKELIVTNKKEQLLTTLPILEVNKARYLLNRLVRYYLLNSKQIHHPNYKAGRNRAIHPSGTGRGKSRQPRAIVNGKPMVSNVPNAVGGPIAHKPSRYTKKIKINKKELEYLKQNALSIILRRKSTEIVEIDTIKENKLKTNLNLISPTKIIRNKILVTENLLILSSLKNHPKLTLVKGLRFDQMLKGGIKNKNFILDLKVILPILK